MPEYTFERECRTAYSESYLVLDEGGRPLGRVDLHFTPTVVHSTLCVGEDMTQESIQDLIEAVDEELVSTADVPREDFIVRVHQGRDAGVYSDQGFGENGNGDA